MLAATFLDVSCVFTIQFINRSLLYLESIIFLYGLDKTSCILILVHTHTALLFATVTDPCCPAFPILEVHPFRSLRVVTACSLHKAWDVPILPRGQGDLFGYMGHALEWVFVACPLSNGFASRFVYQQFVYISQTRVLTKCTTKALCTCHT